MADSGIFGSLSPALLQLLQDNGQGLKNGFVNGAKSFGNQAAWTVGGMNGSPPAPIVGDTANQYVDQKWPSQLPISNQALLAALLKRSAQSNQPDASAQNPSAPVGVLSN